MGKFLESQVGYQMRRASGAIMADLAGALAELELKIGEASVLIVIAESPGCTQSEIGRRLGIQRANMAPLMANLVNRGLVERSHSDGRSTDLHLSAAGQAVTQQVRERIAAHEDRMFANHAPEERAALRRLLERVWS